MDALFGLKLLRILAPRLAALVVVVGCTAFPQQTTAVVMDAAEKRAAQLVEMLKATFALGESSRDKHSEH